MTLLPQKLKVIFPRLQFQMKVTAFGLLILFQIGTRQILENFFLTKWLNLRSSYQGREARDTVWRSLGWQMWSCLRVKRPSTTGLVQKKNLVELTNLITFMSEHRMLAWIFVAKGRWKAKLSLWLSNKHLSIQMCWMGRQQEHYLMSPKILLHQLEVLAVMKFQTRE